MFRFLLNVLGTFIFAGALAAAIIDAYDSFKIKRIVTHGLLAFLQTLIPTQYEGLFSFLNARLSPNLAHLFEGILNSVPTFLVLAVVGCLLMVLAAKPKRKIGFSSR